MKIGILGSGPVGVALASGFLNEGYEVLISTRDPEGPKGLELQNLLHGATVTNFETASEDGDIIILCVNSGGYLDVIKRVKSHLTGKILIDTTNVMKPHEGLLIYAGGEQSVAEKLQTLLPDSHIVKAFNTVGAATMYKPDFGDQIPTMFIAGNDAGAKQQAADLIKLFGWETFDCGPIFAARPLEAMVPIWVNYSVQSKSAHHAFKMLT